MSEFKFDDKIAQMYDDGLVPVLFEPWAVKLADEFGPWDGLDVLDVATGTGIVYQNIRKRMGTGTLIGIDISEDMLKIAKERNPDGNFIKASANSIPLETDGFDKIVSQQGFQFFPDKLQAANEMSRLLRSGGELFLTMWKSVEYCEYWRWVCDALDELGYPDLSSVMKKPFNFANISEVLMALTQAGFIDIEVTEHELEMYSKNRDKSLVDLVYSTPIAPMLNKLPKMKQSKFIAKLKTQANKKGPESLGIMVTYQITARLL